MSLLPRSCWGCQALLAPLGPGDAICDRCALGIDPIDPSLPRPDGIQSLYAYQGLLVTLLKRLKFQADRSAAHPLGRLWWQAPANPLRGPHSFDAIVPIPLHPRRTLVRGYNQCEEMLHWGAATAWRQDRKELPPLLRALLRRRSTQPQHALDRTSREANLAGAFSVRSMPRLRPDLALLVVDDVHTTGATLKSALRTLRAAGLLRCQGLALLRAEPVSGPAQ